MRVATSLIVTDALTCDHLHLPSRCTQHPAERWLGADEIVVGSPLRMPIGASLDQKGEALTVWNPATRHDCWLPGIANPENQLNQTT